MDFSTERCYFRETAALLVETEKVNDCLTLSVNAADADRLATESQ